MSFPKLIDNATSPTTSSVVTVRQGSGKSSTMMSFQLSVTGAGSVSASAVLEGSHDGQGWFEIATLTCSGTTYATDGGPLETLWPMIRCRLTAVTGTASVYGSL